MKEAKKKGEHLGVGARTGLTQSNREIVLTVPGGGRTQLFVRIELTGKRGGR